MQIRHCLRWSVGVSLGALGVSVAAANHAVRVVEYQPGTGAGKFTNAVAALGAPERETVDPSLPPEWQRSAVDPFAAPYLASQVVSLGADGVLTLEFERPVFEDPSNPGGIDFLVFGNAFFQLDSDWTTTTGLLGGTNEGVTRVWVSHDGTVFYRLDPARAPAVDAWYPTDGAGDFTRPMAAGLGSADFAGKDLSGVRQAYAGSGGGAGYDLQWAQDDQGSNVVMQSARFVRLEQSGGSAEVDALSAVSRPPAVVEDFTTDPAARGWSVFGDVGLFAWDAGAGQLEVTWDSSQPNSYFECPLGTVLSRQDDFLVAFDLRLNDVSYGTTPGKPYTFQLALGLMDRASAHRPEFYRGVGTDPAHGPRNLLELDYFPDSGFGATVSPTVVASNTVFASGFVFPLELPVGEWLEVTLRFSASNQVLRTVITRGGQVLHEIADVSLTPGFTDFRLDTVAVCSYSDAGQDPMFAGSITAHGLVDRLAIVVPDAPVAAVEVAGLGAAGFELQPFAGRAGWTYRLWRSVDFQTWDEVASARTQLATNQPVRLSDPSASGGRAFYQVRAEKP